MRAGSLICSWLVLWLCAETAAAQSGPVRSEPQVIDMRVNADRRTPDPGAFARGAAIYGTVSAGLMLGGAMAIAAIDDQGSERITRGAWLGTAVLSAPFVALGGWTARKRAKVEGYQKLRWLGWTTWTFALANGILQWYEAFHDDSQHWGLTVGLGALGAISVLPMAFDAFASGRRASLRSRFGIGLSPSGLTIAF